MQIRWSVTRYCKAIIVLAVAFNVLSCNRNDEPELAQMGDQVYNQYRTADYPTAKAALLGWIRDLEGRLSNPSDPSGEVYKADIMTSYVRLAKLEEKNNGSEKETYMQKAVAICQQLKLKWNCAGEEVRKRVDGMDSATAVK